MPKIELTCPFDVQFTPEEQPEVFRLTYPELSGSDAWRVSVGSTTGTGLRVVTDDEDVVAASHSWIRDSLYADENVTIYFETYHPVTFTCESGEW